MSFTPTQYGRYHVTGCPVNSEMDGQVSYAGGTVVKVYDEYVDNRRVVYARVQNLGTEPIFYAEDYTTLNAAPPGKATTDPLTGAPAWRLGTCGTLDGQFSGVISAGSAGNDGLGNFAEWDRYRPHCIYVTAVNAFRAAIVRRYADES